VENRWKVVAVVIAVVVVVAGAVTYVVLAGPRSAPSQPAPSGTATCTPSAGGSSAGNWTTYHQDDRRQGFESSAPVSGVHPTWTSPVLDGSVYAEPLACGDAIYVATEGDSVYALNSTTGSILWSTNLGTPVPGSSLPCGDIDPSGITGTPVIDTGAGILYVVAFVTPAQHVLYSLDVSNGSVRSHLAVDPPGADPTVEQQRGALALANGFVYVPYGGLYGDCGAYHGWVVGAPTSGAGGLLSYQVPTMREGGIWSPAGAAVSPTGVLYVATGNGASTTTFDFGDSVIELSPSLTELDYFAPTNWAQLNAGDTDLGSVAPSILSNGDIFQIGKSGVGYLLSGSHLGGIGGEVANLSVCGGAYGGTAQVGSSILVPCTDGLFDVVAGASNLSLAWHSNPFDAGSPIVTGNVVWAVDIGAGNLLGFNLTTGQQVATLPVGPVDHFISPSAGPQVLYVAATNQVHAFAWT
jgi:outer membrane protein assembly factor BamB